MVDVVEEALIQYIIKNDLRAGDAIPHENDLAQMMGVGRNVIREALSRLKSRGLLSSRRHRGIEIEKPEINKELEKVIIPQLLSKEDVVNLLELRYTLEIGMVPSLFRNVSDNDISNLEKILNRQVREDGKIAVESEQAFHSCIYAISNNIVLEGLLKRLISLFRYVNVNYEDFNRFNIQIKQQNQQASHEDLLACLKARDANAYTEMIARHLLAYKLYVEEFRANEL